MGITATYGVDGMTCGHCVSAVTEELSKPSGVREVAVHLAPGAMSSVRVVSDAEPDESEVRDAVEEAGCQLTGTGD